MHIRCPHCHNHIELIEELQDEIVCSSCGSAFRINPDSTRSWKPGQRLIGRFEVIETIGVGAFGTVIKARDPELDRIVAVKIPRTGNIGSSGDVDRFLREARNAAQLKHPSIVAVHEVGQDNGTPYIVSDFIEGVTLSDWLSAKKPSFRESAELVASIASALHFAHEHGVVHRDVKPSNILIDNAGRPHLMDFGLAKRDAGEITMTVNGQVLGTPAYMSPEQAKGEAHTVDGRSDVYSLGVVLYVLLTGELPFRGTSRMLLYQVMHDEPKQLRRLNDRIPRDLETITLKSLDKEPAKRYESAREFANDLTRWLAEEPVLARPTGRLERVAKWARRNPSWAGLIIVSLAAVLVPFVGGLIYNHNLRAALKREAATAKREIDENIRAQRFARMTVVQRLVADSRSVRDEFPIRSTLLALEGLKIAGANDETSAVAAENELLECLRTIGGFPLTGNTSTIFSLEISPDGRWVACGSNDGTARLWDLTDAPEIKPRVLQHSRSQNSYDVKVTFSPNGRWLVTYQLLSDIAQLWDLSVPDPSANPISLQQCDRQIPEFGMSPEFVHVKKPAFSSSSQRLVTHCIYEVRVWDLAAANPSLSPRVIPLSSKPFSQLTDSALSGATDRLAISTTKDEVRVWDLETAASISLPNSAGVTNIEISANGRWVTDGVRLWDLHHEPPLIHNLPPEFAPVMPKNFGQKGSQLAQLAAG